MHFVPAEYTMLDINLHSACKDIKFTDTLNNILFFQTVFPFTADQKLIYHLWVTHMTG